MASEGKIGPHSWNMKLPTRNHSIAQLSYFVNRFLRFSEG
jgi:hypothetical protein